MTASEKKASEMSHNSEAGLNNPSIQVRIRSPVNMDCSYELISEEARHKAIEEAFLTPEANHFISTPEVIEMESRLSLWLQAGYPVHLIGPTGCGKTSLAVHVAKGLGRPVVWINGDEAITTSDLIGGYSQMQSESVRDNYVHNVFKTKDTMKIEWVDNPLSLACKFGYTLIYNEFSRTKPASNNVLLSVFEEGILTSNSIEYAGIHRPQDALLDRMVGIYADYYGYETEVRIVMEHTGISQDKAERIVQIIRSIREKLPDAQKPGTRACIMIAKGMQTLKGRDDLAIDFKQLCIDVIANKTCSPQDMEEKKRLVMESAT